MTDNKEKIMKVKMKALRKEIKILQNKNILQNEEYNKTLEEDRKIRIEIENEIAKLEIEKAMLEIEKAKFENEKEKARLENENERA